MARICAENLIAGLTGQKMTACVNLSARSVAAGLRTKAGTRMTWIRQG